MNKRNKNNMNRRDFVATSTVAVVGAATCFSIGAREALARARATGTITLTAENLNRLFEEHYKSGRIKTVAKEISADITGWIGRQCTLTPLQERRVKSIPKEKWDDVRKVLQVVAEKGGRLTVEISDVEGVFKHHATGDLRWESQDHDHEPRWHYHYYRRLRSHCDVTVNSSVSHSVAHESVSMAKPARKGAKAQSPPQGAFRAKLLMLIISVAVVLLHSSYLALAAVPDEAVHVSANFGANQPLSPRGRIELHTSRSLLEKEGRFAVVIGDTDVTSLCVVSGNDIVYIPKPLPLPRGETSVIVYLVSAQNEWTEVSRLPLLVEEPKISPVTTTKSATETPALARPPAQSSQSPGPFQFIPSVSVNVKAQSTALFFPELSRPDRINFTDIAVQMTLQGNYHNQVVSIQNQFDFAGSSVENEALRFGRLGSEAPQFDLSAYTMQYQVFRSKLRLGNVSFGSNRHLINSFASRGISLTVPITKRFDLSGAMMNGTSIVGYENFFGVKRKQHRVYSATLGIEVLEKRPGGFRLEVSALNGSLLPLSNFNQGLVSDAEKSKGGSIRLVGSDTSQRLRFDAGFARSRFTNPGDPLLYQGRKVIPVKPVWRNARYLDLNYDLLRSYKLTD